MMRPHFLYVVEMVGAPLAKIGIGVDPMQRLMTFAAANPFTIRFRRVFRFDDVRDASAHERHIITKANAHRDGGEWVCLDATLDALLDACPGRDVTGDFAHRIYKGKGRRVSDGATARVNALRLQVGAQAAQASGYRGAAGDYDAAVVRARIAAGYGVEDIRVMDGIPEEFSRALVFGKRRAAA